jgi:hypothetical protein
VPDLFEDLNDQSKFCDLVGSHFSQAPHEISAVMACAHTLSPERVEYAYGEYKQNINKFAVLLHSENPDHYKRAGALLHALNSSKIVVAVDLESSAEDLETGFTRVQMGDANHILHFVKFYNEYYNQALAFDFAYRCCAAYETNPRTYDFDYLHNVCRYLKAQPNVSVDSCFILFKSLMT